MGSDMLYYSGCGSHAYAGMAQLVEQLIRNQQVAGSSPATSLTLWDTQFFCFCRTGSKSYAKKSYKHRSVAQHTIATAIWRKSDCSNPDNTKKRAFKQHFKCCQNTRHTRSDRIRTCGINVPNVARYQLRHTPVFTTGTHILYPILERLSRANAAILGNTNVNFL